MSTKFIQLPTCNLAEFVSSSATSFDVSGFLYNDGTTAVDTADIGDVCFATMEPKTSREELVSFTISSVTTAGVATLTVTRGLSQKSPYGTGGATFDHQNGSDFVISNNPGLFDKLAAKANDETITGSWKFPTTPTHVQNPVTKSHFDDNTVKLTGDQTVAGEKTFSTSPKIPDSGDVDEALTKGESDTIEATNVKLTGAQTVAGVKTFSSSPIVPTATASTEAINKAQAEAYVAANSGDIKASDSAYGTTKLDVAADTPAEPVALTATQDRQDAINGGGDFGTPSDTNKFVTEDKLVVAEGFGDSSDGDVTISTPTTLTSDMYYENLTVNSTLTTDGYVIYVRKKIDGTGTIQHSTPSTGADAVNTSGGGSNQCAGGGGGGGASSGNVVILASVWAGTFTIEAIGDDGGAGSPGTNTASGADAQTGGVGGTQRGNGQFAGLAGGAGGDGKSADNTKDVGVAGTSTTNLSQVVAGKAGGTGGIGDGKTGGVGGSGGSVTAPTKNVDDHRFLAESLLALDSSLAFDTFYENPGSGGGGAGYNEAGVNAAGGGGGGGGGNGGDIIVVYKKKTWTGSSDMSGGAAGSNGGGCYNGGGGCTSGLDGTAGSNGELIEVDHTVIK